MRTTAILALILVIFSTGCTSTFSSLPAPATMANHAPLIPGREYQVETIRKTDGARTSYTGLVDRVDDESVVFAGALKRVEITRSPRIPLVGRMFSNTAMGEEQLDGEVRVSRNELTAVKERAHAHGHSAPE